SVGTGFTRFGFDSRGGRNRCPVRSDNSASRLMMHETGSAASAGVQKRITVDDLTVVNHETDLLQIANVGRWISVDHEHVRVISHFDVANIPPPKCFRRTAGRGG